MTRAGYRTVEGCGEPQILVSVDEGNEEYAVIVHACTRTLEGIVCITAPVDPMELLRAAREVEELRRAGYAAAGPREALEHARDVAREKLEELKRRYSCNDLAERGGPN